MDHFGGNIQRRFAGQELNAAPTPVAHAPGIVAGQPHRAHHVDLEEPLPVVVVDIEEALGLEDAHVIDQDIRVRMGVDQCLAAVGPPQIGGDAGDAVALGVLLESVDRLVHPFLGAAGDHHVRAGQGQAPGDTETNTGGGAGNDRFLA